MSTILVIAAMGAVTFALRFCFFGPLDTSQLPRDVESALPYIMPAVLMAIIVPDVLAADGNSGPGPGWITPSLVGALAGFSIGAFKRDNLWLIVGVAMAAFLASSVVL